LFNMSCIIAAQLGKTMAFCLSSQIANRQISGAVSR